MKFLRSTSRCCSPALHSTSSAYLLITLITTIKELTWKYSEIYYSSYNHVHCMVTTKGIPKCIRQKCTYCSFLMQSCFSSYPISGWLCQTLWTDIFVEVVNLQVSNTLGHILHQWLYTQPDWDSQDILTSKTFKLYPYVDVQDIYR